MFFKTKKSLSYHDLQSCIDSSIGTHSVQHEVTCLVNKALRACSVGRQRNCFIISRLAMVILSARAPTGICKHMHDGFDRPHELHDVIGC